MNLKILTLSLSMAFAFSATAQEKVKKAKAPKATNAPLITELQTSSEYLYQAPAKKLVLKTRIHYNSVSSKMTPSFFNADIKQTEIQEELGFEYGLNEATSVGFSITNADGTREMSPAPLPALAEVKTTGLKDPSIYMNGRSSLGSGLLRYGANLTYALGKHKVSSDFSENNASGGMTLAPFVGYEISTSSSKLGLRALYEVLKTDRKIDNAGTAETESGGKTFVAAVFFEKNQISSLVGTALEIVAAQKAKNTNPNSISPKAMTLASVKVYGRFEMTPTFTIIPEASYGQGTALDTANFESLNLWNVKLAGRFTF